MSATSVGEIGLDLVVNQKQFHKQMSGIMGIAKKAGVALAAAFGVKKLADFSKQCLELGSDLQEVQNVVDVTFPAMTAQVDKFAKSAAQNFGLSETMAKRFTGTFGAMAKAFGFSEKEAYNMGTALTGLAGDVASFYNISQDEAYTKLKSVFTGETESLKDLGVVMTQAALDQYALANGYGKTTAAMSEAEKVALRYAFVQQQLSAASGDFIRTSDSWANQVRILKLQIDSLKATIGQGLINLFTPIIKVVNTVIGKLATLANAFKAFTELITGKKSSGGTSIASPVADLGAAAGSAAGRLSSAGDAAKGLSGATKDVGKSAKKAAKEMRALMGFDQINRLDKVENTPETGNGDSSSTPSVGGGGIGSAVDFGSLAQGETIIDQVDSKFTKMFQNIVKWAKPSLDALKNLWNQGLSKLGKFAWGSLKDFYHGFLVPVGKWVLGKGLPDFINTLNNGLLKVDFDKIRSYLRKLWDALTPFTVNVGEGLLWLWKNALVPLGTWAANEVVPRFLDTLSIAIGIVNNILKAFQPLFQWFWDNVLLPIANWTGGIFLQVWDGINAALQKFSEWCAGLQPKIEGISQMFSNLASWVSQNSTVIEILGVVVGGLTAAIIANTVAGNAHNIAMGLSAVAIGVYNGVTTIATTVTSAFSAVLAFLTSPITLVIAAITALIATGVLLYKNWDTIKEYAVQIWTSIKDFFIETWENIKAKAEAVWTSIKETLSSLWGKLKESVSSIFGEIKTKISEIWESIKTTTGEVWEKIKEFISEPIEKAKEAISTALDAIKTKFSDIFESIKNVVRTPVNGIIGFLNGLINGVARAVNSIAGMLNNMRVDIPDWVPGIGGGTLGFNLPTWTPAQIPYLAQGGYVKPNTPQLAMIGDNRHQGEVVAPEDKLEEMARKAAMAAGNGDMTKVLAVLEELLKILKDLPVVTLDPETLRKYFIEKTNERTRANGKPELLY